MAHFWSKTISCIFDMAPAVFDCQKCIIFDKKVFWVKGDWFWKFLGKYLDIAFFGCETPKLFSPLLWICSSRSMSNFLKSVLVHEQWVWASFGKNIILVVVGGAMMDQRGFILKWAWSSFRLTIWDQRWLFFVGHPNGF